MVIVERIDTHDKKQVQRFIDLPFRLYAGNPYWVPPFRTDMEQVMDRRDHPFYEHSTADFFLAVRDGRDVGRIAALENRNYNRFHATHGAQFYYFECENDLEAARALFTQAFDWARARRLDTMIGPKGFSPFDGYGMLQRGFDQRQMMNMMNYNPEYYLRLVEALDFEKEVDFISHFIPAKDFQLDERIHRIAERVQKRRNLQVQRFRSKSELRLWADKIGRTYNQAFLNNWEYVPLTEREISFFVDNIMLVAVPKLIKIITHEEDVVGFAFGWPDVSAAMQRTQGKLFPFGFVRLLWELRRTKGMAGNGMGILSQYQGLGGNALLYTEMEKTIHQSHFETCEITQVAETAVQMRQDLEAIGGIPYKNHRVFRRQL
jgi:hypothetical protein